MYPANRRAHNLLVLGPRRSDAELLRTLGRFVERADRVALARGDPVSLVRRYADPADQEVAGLLVAMLAYGRVASILEKAGRALDLLGPHPAVKLTQPSGPRALAGFVHRFQRGDDLPRFAGAVARVRREYGSLAQAFAAGVRWHEERYDLAMGRFVDLLAAELPRRPSAGLRFLLPHPGRGGAAKRLCLYLRWMIRPDDQVDTGAWRRLVPALSPSKLVVPLDTHIARIARYLGLTERRSDDLRTALEITAALGRLRPDDPLAFDLALCHLGISGRCPRRRVTRLCAGCEIRAVCRLGPEPEDWPARPRSTE